MSLLAPRLSIRRNPADYTLRWESHEEGRNHQLDLTPIRRAYPDAFIYASFEVFADGTLEGLVTVVTRNHGLSEETREMGHTLSAFNIVDTHADQSYGPGLLQQRVFDILGQGGLLPRVYSGEFEFKSAGGAHDFVGRVVKAVENGMDKFEREGERGPAGTLRLRK